MRARFLKQLAAVAALVVASTTTASAGAAHADGASPTGSASTATSVSTLAPDHSRRQPPPGAVPADGEVKVAPGSVYSVQAAWDCVSGYPCLYDGDNGTGEWYPLSCGFHDLGRMYRWDGSTYNDWANSARTYGNSITVYNWDGWNEWNNWGTVPAWSYWNFQLKNQIDGVNVNCASTPPPF
ncbi:hypothetical protein ACIBPB_28090 [Micromonospora sp. NPDC049836]|uniref:hypothetical protein n=1 Tax=Micromonospora sp. NPDC049836 TaxID=3364274 RepID=UPI003794F3B6